MNEKKVESDSKLPKWLEFSHKYFKIWSVNISVEKFYDRRPRQVVRNQKIIASGKMTMCVENEELTKVANDLADFFDEPL